jgi:signal transduction histidine kinase
MSEPAPPLVRRLLPFVVGGAFLVVALIAAWRIWSLRELMESQERARLEATLIDQVATWEDALVRHLHDATDLIAQDTARARERQVRLRSTDAWFNALYLWHPLRAPQGPQRPGRPGAMVFPTQTAPDDDDVWTRPCLQRARWMVQDPSIDPIQAAAAYEAGCAREPLVVRLVAATEAANLLEGTGQLPLALQVLESADLPADISLLDAAKLGLPPFRVATHHILQASIEMKLGREKESLDRLAKIGAEIVALDAPDAVPSLQYVEWPILPQLRRHERTEEAERLAAAHERAARRVVAYREITERILQRPSRDEPPRFVYDQYSDSPFLLYYGWVGDHGVALQLEQNVLLAHFLNTRLRSLRRMVTITDASGAWVAGARRGDEIAVNVPFTKTLTHLRVGVREGAVDAALDSMDEQWLVPFVVLFACVVLGFSALTVWVRASKQQFELLSRQRAFTTRVTHELKTPLAGIRVMAENLEFGAFRDDSQRVELARRIVDEADRLASRVDEVLAVARERTIPDPVAFEPEEALFEAIDQWGPRFEAVQVRFQADIDATEPVVGDPVAFRDAVSCLLDNALKYRREDRADAEVVLRSSQEGAKVIVSVCDNGLGVPKAMRKAIFERFVRVEGPNRGKAGGHGLGLHQVAEIVRAHRGSIKCVDGVDGGACFVIQLPAAKGRSNS